MNLVETQPTPIIREKRFVLRTGLFVGGAFFLAMVIVTVIGKENQLFSSVVQYKAAFENVQGLRVDSPVWLSGMDVGHVQSITFSDNAQEQRVMVALEIQARYAERIREDSVARVSSRGVLGDKVIDVSQGSASAPKLANGAELKTGAGGDMAQMLKTGGEVMENVLSITRDLRRAVSIYADPEMAEDLRGTVATVRRFLEKVEKGDGTVSALLFDPRTKRDVQRLIQNTGNVAQQLDGAIAETEKLLEGVRTGQGAAHALIYDRRSAESVAQLGRAAGELATLLGDARKSPNSAVHQIFYGDQKDLIADLAAMAANLRQVTEKIRLGEGSVGAIINDPTLYEDMKTILGNVKRNRILRALVRFTVSNRGEVADVGQVQATPASAQ